MIIAVSGPSGAGKTTLAQALAKHLGWDFQENSAGKIMRPEFKEELRDMGKPLGLGQNGTINFAHANPAGGKKFQEGILSSRSDLFKSKVEAGINGVYDRSPLDPIVFYLNQVVHNETQEASEEFIHRCIVALRSVDLILRVPLQNPVMEIEYNGSRVNNWFFQKKVDALFDTAIELVLQENNKYPYLLDAHTIRFERCQTWDWEERLDWAKTAANRLVQGY